MCFTVQLSMFVAAFFTSSLFTLPHLIDCVKYSFEVFYFSKFKTSNGEGGIRTLAPLLTTYSLSRGAPSASLGTSPNCPTQSLLFFQKRFILYRVVFYLSRTFLTFQKFFILFKQRREWDSNPRALSDKRFSRPPRYDHFDISPYSLFSVFALLCQRKTYSIIELRTCQHLNLHFFIFFQKSFCNIKIFWCCDLDILVGAFYQADLGAFFLLYYHGIIGDS